MYSLHYIFNPSLKFKNTYLKVYILLVVVLIKISMILKFTYLTTFFTTKAVVVGGKDTCEDPSSEDFSV